MKIKILTLMAGPDGIRKPGQVFDLPQDEADALIAGGYAEKMDATAKAAASAPRAATRGRGRTATKPEADAEANPAEPGEDAAEA